MHTFYRNKLVRIFTPAGYLKFINDSSNRDSILKVKFLPPKLGSSGFGKIYTELKYASKYFRSKTKYWSHTKAMDHQAMYMSKRPAENRKTLTRIGWVVGLLLIAVMGFLTTWIFLGKDQFAYKFLQGSGYIITTILGYWLGSKNKKEDKGDSNVNDAEVVGWTFCITNFVHYKL